METKSFFARTRTAKKVMVLDLGFLGDTVHLLPALWMVRQAYPSAELHVAVALHITSFMDCVPWVDHVWGYMRFPRHATLRENFRYFRVCGRKNLTCLSISTARIASSWLTFLSGARERLGRLPDGGGPPFWRRMFTAHVHHPFGEEPVYIQRCRCLEKAGFPFTAREFHVEIDPKNLRAAEISETDAETYFHSSPFTTADHRELRPAQLVELIAELNQKFPVKKIVLSCAPTEREQKKMAELLMLLPQKPWRVFAGNLNLMQIAAVIKHSALHFCGNTGTLHLAVMTQTPTVTWFWPGPGLRDWVPAGEKYHIVTGTNNAGESFLGNIATGQLVHAAESALSAR